MRHFRWALLLSFLAVATASAFADGFDFKDIFNSIPKTGTFALSDISGQAGITVSGATVTVAASGGTTFTITGYWYNGTVWTTSGVTLIGRNEAVGQSVDHGIGICSSGETNCLGSGSGDTNEISNQLHPEVFQISMSGTPDWTKVGLSSLDNNGAQGNPPEHGQLYSSNTNINNTGTALSSLNVLCNFSISGAPSGFPCTTSPFSYPSSTEEPDIQFAENHDSYLYLTANDTSDSTNVNNDFLLRRLNDPGTPPPPVPEPSSLMLLATGLGAASLAAKKFRG